MKKSNTNTTTTTSQEIFERDLETILSMNKVTPAEWKLIPSTDPKAWEETTPEEDLDAIGALKKDTSWVDHDRWAGFIVVTAVFVGIVACWSIFVS